MKNRRKFSIFISSTYEDLKKERQALVGVALENNFIPVGMEQFHAAPTSQWNVITKMIDECDFYLLVIGARYGSIDEETGISYTEKEYNYAKTKGLPVLVLIKQPSAISEREKSGMFKMKWFQMKFEISIGNLPLLRQIKKFPLSAAFIASVVMSVFLFPLSYFMRCVPNHLRVRAYKNIITPPL